MCVCVCVCMRQTESVCVCVCCVSIGGAETVLNEEKITKISKKFWYFSSQATRKKHDFKQFLEPSKTINMCVCGLCLVFFVVCVCVCVCVVCVCVVCVCVCVCVCVEHFAMCYRVVFVTVSQ